MGLHLRVGERKPARLGITVGDNCLNVPVGSHGSSSGEQGGKGGEAAHSWEIRRGLGGVKEKKSDFVKQINQAEEGTVCPVRNGKGQEKRWWLMEGRDERRLKRGGALVYEGRSMIRFYRVAVPLCSPDPRTILAMGPFEALLRPRCVAGCFRFSVSFPIVLLFWSRGAAWLDPAACTVRAGYRPEGMPWPCGAPLVHAGTPGMITTLAGLGRVRPWHSTAHGAWQKKRQKKYIPGAIEPATIAGHLL